MTNPIIILKCTPIDLIILTIKTLKSRTMEMEAELRRGRFPHVENHTNRLLKPENTYAIAKVSRFSLIDIGRINKLTGTNIRGAILDVKACMSPHDEKMQSKNIETTIKMVREGVRIVVFPSMGTGAEYLQFISEIEKKTGYRIKIVMSRHPNPNHGGFQEASESLNLGNTEKPVLIGDDFVTGGNCIKAGIPFIKVEPTTTKESPYQRINEAYQKGRRAFYSRLSDIHDFVLNRRVLKDVDFKPGL